MKKNKSQIIKSFFIYLILTIIYLFVNKSGFITQKYVYSNAIEFATTPKIDTTEPKKNFTFIYIILTSSTILLTICSTLIFIHERNIKIQNSHKKTENVTIKGVAGMYENAKIIIAWGDELIFGRDAMYSSLIIDKNAEKISRKHCSVKFDESKMQYRVTDFSTNGTYKLNGDKFNYGASTLVPRSTVIVLGDLQNQFMLM